MTNKLTYAYTPVNMYNISTTFDVYTGIVVYVHDRNSYLSARLVPQEVQTQRLVSDYTTTSRYIMHTANGLDKKAYHKKRTTKQKTKQSSNLGKFVIA